MATGISLHIGLNFVDPNAYYGWDGELAGCINDANDMMRLAQGLNFNASQLIDGQATAANVIQRIANAAETLQAGDLFLISYSGHGGQIPDEEGLESDGYNETWVLYDRELLDNELYRLWERFRQNVRIVVISDSCHSGTVVKKLLRERRRRRPAPIIAPDGHLTPTEDVTNVIREINNKVKEYKGLQQLTPISNIAATDTIRLRFMPFEVNMKDYYGKKDQYVVVRTLSGSKSQNPIKANLILISGCQDNQLSSDGDANGLFTGTLLRTRDNGNFSGTYRSFHEAILAQMPPYQTPNFFLLGPEATQFDLQAPFQIGEGGTEPANNDPAPNNSTPQVDPNDPNPYIFGPATWSRTGSPPVFNIHKGRNQYYYVEVCTQNQLLDYNGYGQQRNSSNFFATWNDPQFANYGRLTAPTFQLPDYAWNAFKNSDRLYYRIGTTSSLYSWDNFMISLPDLDYQNAPSVTLSNGSSGPGGLSGSSGAPGNTRNFISSSVGEGGTNSSENVSVIQALLNVVPSAGGPNRKLMVDGEFGNLTLAAIRGFQDYHLINSDYGIIHPASQTIRKVVEEQSNSLVLNGSVGSGGSNQANDVGTIQSALNKVNWQAGGPSPRLVVDGIYGQKTLSAIQRFQNAYFTGNDQNGLITPGSNTITLLNSFQ